ncbi:hypothetical protein TD95_000069 [Thielaviopsis punctulata]|uniref:Cep57 centrosome microtubule-binding domain-containing protein n=1 Tax=Thielaviopsis punctulata TaxID=72032 RepID=A0A0F4Z8S2_9PEZI|nr:hypothetical protein TD95_000069 [Thielaviopsis punctulata]
MEADSAEGRYRSRILREMNANRENPFNSPPSSTGSHGTLDPTVTSNITDQEGDSTRRLNEDIARITGNGRKPSVNWDAIHNKWPEFYPKPKPLPTGMRRNNGRDPVAPTDTETKENRPPKQSAKKLHSIDNLGADSFDGSNRTRAEMQPRVESEPDASSILNLSPERPNLPPPTRLPYQPQHGSPLARQQTRSPSTPEGSPVRTRRPSLPAALSKENTDGLKLNRKLNFAQHRLSKEVKAATKQLKKQQKQQQQKQQQVSNQRRARQLFNAEKNETFGSTIYMPDISNLGDFVSGTLRFDGTVKNGVPILVRNGKVVDIHEDPSNGPNSNGHADVDGIKVPDDEEKMFVSMDMIRDEIIALQEHNDFVQNYAEGLQQEIEELQTQIESIKSRGGGNTLTLEKNSGEKVAVNESLLEEKKQLEEDAVVLRYRLQEMTKKYEIADAQRIASATECERSMKKLQEACETINDLMSRLDMSEHELHVTQKQLDANYEERETGETLLAQMAILKDTNKKLRSDNEALKRDAKSLRDSSNHMQRELDAVQREADSLRMDNNHLRRDYESLIKENQSLRSNSRLIMTENDELRTSVDAAQHDVSDARIELERLHQVIGTMRDDGASHGRGNNGILRGRDNVSDKALQLKALRFERDIRDLNAEVDFLKAKFMEFSGEDNRNNQRPSIFASDSDHRADANVQEENTRAFNRRVLNQRLANLVQQTQTLNLTADLKEPTQSGIDFTSLSFKDLETSDHPQLSKPNKNGNSVKFDVPDMSMSTEDQTNTNTRQSVASRSNRFLSRDSTRDFSIRVDSQDVEEPRTKDATASSKNKKSRRKSFSQPTDLTEQLSDQRPISSFSMREAAHQTIQDTYEAVQEPPYETVPDSYVAVQDSAVESCPVLSNDARKVLDDLCDHNCRNCTVCSRITNHHPVAERITIPRPIPASDRAAENTLLSIFAARCFEDPTLRPAQAPGHALAIVIKALEDESEHLNMQLTQLQAEYNALDKGVGKRVRKDMASRLRSLLKQLEAKSDQIYALYDVLEGQKAAGQHMTEEELELTIQSITGMHMPAGHSEDEREREMEHEHEHEHDDAHEQDQESELVIPVSTAVEDEHGCF